jgi:hypothetical protein
MSVDQLDSAFYILTLLVLPFWILMLLAPMWEVSIRIVRSYWPFVPIACAYVLIVLPQIATVLPQVLHPSPREQLAYFATPAGYLAIYSHALALDLFVGRWVYLDAYRSRRSPWLVSPLLLVVMLLGPLGLLLYLGIRGNPARSDLRGSK